jgi:hypothetical protein
LKSPVDILLGVIESNRNDITFCKIPANNLFPIHHIDRMMKANGSFRMIAILPNQISALIGAIIIGKILFAYNMLMAEPNHDVA